MDEPNPTDDGRLLGVLMTAFVATMTLAAVDLLSDMGEGIRPAHVLIEATILAVGLIGAVLVGRALLATVRSARDARAHAAALEGQLARTRAEAARWRAEAGDLVAGLAEAIDAQLEAWRLSPAEKETAMLLLKGLSHREIAAARSVTEATARQQARAIYRKAGLAGRHDLAAFFLEDLLVPVGER